MTTQLSSGELLEQFNESGYVILKGLFDAHAVEAARAALNGLVDQHAEKLLKAGAVTDLMADHPFEMRMYDLYRDCLDDAPDYWRAELHLGGLFNIFLNPQLLDIVESIIGPEVRLYPNYTARPKMPNQAQTLVLWHQDGGYTEKWHKSGSGDVGDLTMVNVWTPLVPARANNGCMQFIPGTHRVGLLPHEQREFYLEIPAEDLDKYADEIVDIELDPGDAVLFHNMLCHQGQPNLSDSIRWSMDWRFQVATQPTLREEQGHLARSQTQPERAVTTAEQWGNLSFC